MRRVLGMISILLLVSIACQTLLPEPTPTLPPTVTATLTATATPTITVTPTLLPSLTAQPGSSATPSPAGLPFAPEVFTVLYHPDGALYVGDLVSLEVIPPQGRVLADAQLTLQVDDEAELTIGPAPFAEWGIAARQQATLIWAWDTRGLAAGFHTLHFSIQPQGMDWNETVTLLPEADVPDQAEWAVWETACCVLHYVTNSAAERDLTALVSQVQEQAQQAAKQMGAAFDEKVVITLLPRLLGHGGFASSEIHVSYLDRNYAANDWDQVLYHELVHLLDGRQGGDLRTTLFVEGLAVYMSGGHYKPEPLMHRASVLLEDELDWYLPLQALADDFYASQHEIGYLEAGALVEYMIQAYGKDEFLAFYRDIHTTDSGLQSEAIDLALQKHFNISFSELELEFMAALRALPDSSAWAADVRITVFLFDTLRRYQQLLDPSAYFRTAWLLDSVQMRQRGITADYVRHPSSPENITLETMMVAAGEDLDNPPYPQADRLLRSVDAVLDAIEMGEAQAFSVDDLANDYYSIVKLVLAAGFEPQKIYVEGTAASVQAVQGSTALETLSLQKLDGQWKLVR